MAVMDDDERNSPQDDDDLPPILNPYSRDDLEYDLIVRQEPKQARMCGVGTKADRRPIDPPPVVQLRVVEKGSRSRRSSSPDDRAHYNQSFLQNPYYFMYASLASPERDEELHLLKDGKTRCTTGSVVSSLYHLKDPEADSEGRTGRDAGFFVFPDLSVRTEGTYRLKLTLFEVIGANVHHCKSIFSAPFYVYTAKKFPGMEESTNLSCALADQGIKIRIRKDVRVRKRTMDPHWFQPVQRDDGGSDVSDDEGVGREAKRHRNEAGPPPPPPPAVPPPASSSGTAGGTWGSINPALPPAPAPPPPTAPEAVPYDARSSFTSAPAPASLPPSSTPAPLPPAAGAAHPEYPPPQIHQHAPYMPPPPHPSGMYAGAYGWAPVPPPPPHAQGYGAYPGYDHHRASPYGAPPAMHYGAPPPYGYYDQHGQYGHPPPATAQPQHQQPPQAAQQSPQSESSPRSAGGSATSTGQSPAQQGRGKDVYPLPPPPSASTPGMMPPPGGYAGQEYAYGRPPPPPPGSSSSAPAQTRGYHTSPGPVAPTSAPGPPPPQSAPAAAPGGMPGGYSQPQSQGHMGHYLPAPPQHQHQHQHQHAPYGYPTSGADPYAHPPPPPPPQQQPQSQAQHQQQHQHQQQQQWGYAPAPAPFAGYARPGWGSDPYGGGGGGGYASQPQGGYVRPGPEESGRRSPPVPSISGQGRVYGNSTGSGAGSGSTPSGSAGVGSPTRGPSSSGVTNPNGSGGVGATGSDRIQLAPLRQAQVPGGGGPGSAGAGGGGVEQAAYANGVVGVGGVGVGMMGKKNPLSIGSIISDES